MLYNLGLTMAYHCASNTDISSFLWYAERDLCRSFDGVAHCCTLSLFGCLVLFFFFFGINLCASWGAKPHVALLVKVTSKLCNDMSMGPNTSNFYPHSPKAVVA